MAHTVYILYSETLDIFYIGSTDDILSERIRKHLTNHKGYTARTKDWKLVYTEIYKTKSESLKREKEIKSWKSKSRIRSLIQKNE